MSPGFVTDGEFDLRPLVDRHGIPQDLTGRRALDVATFNGFWAFELERRGAEVVALDLRSREELDWPAFRPREDRPHPPGEGFEIAHRLRGSSVVREYVSVYDADPGLLGSFDLIFCGSLLIHLKRQFDALERMRALLRSGGMLISAEPYWRRGSLLPIPLARCPAALQGAPVFWEPNPKGWETMLRVGGFNEVRRVGKFAMRSPRGYSVPTVVHRAHV